MEISKFISADVIYEVVVIHQVLCFLGSFHYFVFTIFHEIFNYYFSSALHCQNFVATVYALLHFFCDMTVFFSHTSS